MRRAYVPLLAVFFLGCVTSRAVAPSELARLDGYRADDVREGAEPVLATLDGGQLTMRADSELFLDLPGGRVGGQFDTIRVHDGTFEGRTSDGDALSVRMAELKRAEVHQPDGKLTVAAVAGGVLALLLTGVLVVSLRSSGSQPVEGRALRVRGKTVTAAVATTEPGAQASADAEAGWGHQIVPDTSALPESARSALAAVWTARARSEHASVPAFARLSLSLIAHGAPASLVEAVHVAARQEIVHARLTFALAGAYAGGVIAPRPLAELFRAPAVTATSLWRLAEESLVDGVLMEGTAAAAAAEELAAAQDPAVREALRIIARDEAAHAELAWRILDWCCARHREANDDGSDLRRGLHQLLLRMPAPQLVPPGAPAPDAELLAHGYISPEAWRRHFEETRAAAALRLSDASPAA